MKKIIFTFALAFLLPLSARAATVYSENTNTFQQNESKDLWPVTITAQAEGEITAQNGIRLVLEPEIKILWDAVPTLSASGSAVTQGRVAAAPKPEYLGSYTVLRVPVLADFRAGESVTLQGLRIRAYRYSFGARYLGLDLNADGTRDTQDINKLQVLESLVTDRTPPYAPADFTATVSPDLKSVSIHWKNPPDPDWAGSLVDRKRVRAGVTQENNLLNNTTLISYIDTDVQPGDTITYKLYSTDNVNFSDPVIQTVEIKASPAPQPVPQPTPAPTPTPNPEEEEAQVEIRELTALYPYYKTRHAIKCREGVSPTDSKCLWAKIDLFYTMQTIGRVDSSVTLTPREIELMRKRVIWPEKRYQTECVQAQTPAKSCPALQKALKRIHYFIDQP